MDGIVQLSPSQHDKRLAREALVDLVACQTDSYAAGRLIDGLIQLALAEEDKRQIIHVLLRLLSTRVNAKLARQLTGGILNLDPTSGDKRQVCKAILNLLASPTDDTGATHLVMALMHLELTVHDLNSCPACIPRLSVELLDEIRHNSTLADWLAILPSLPSQLPARSIFSRGIPLTIMASVHI